MKVKLKDDAGVSLVETVIALVMVGVVVSALLATLGTAALSSKSHRDLTTADRLLRSYAEAAKESARTGCASGLTFTIAYNVPSDVAARGFSVVPLGSQACPSISTTLPLTLAVNGPQGLTKRLHVDVRKS